MANSFESSALTKDMGSPTVIRGTPAVAAMPEYKVYTTTSTYTTWSTSATAPFIYSWYRTDWEYGLTGRTQQSYDGQGPVTLYEFWVTRRDFTLVPATPYVPAVPDQVLVNYVLGWNAGARSKRGLVGDGAYRFRVPADTVGAVLGLVAENLSTSYQEAFPALKFASGELSVLENDGSWHVLAARYEADLYLLYDWRNARVGVSASRSWADVFYEVSTAAKGFEDSPVYLDVALYSGGDQVLDPVLYTGGGQVDTPLAYEGVGYSGASGYQPAGRLPRLRVSGRKAWGGSKSLPPVRSFGLWTDRFGLADMPAVVVDSGPGLTVRHWGKQDTNAPRLAVAATLSSGQNYRQDVDSPAPYGYASDSTLFGRQPSGRLGYRSTAYGIEGNHNVTISETVVSAWSQEVDGLIAVVMTSTGRIGSMFGTSLEASIASVMRLAMSVAFDDDDLAEVWVFNTRTGASTRYANYRFNSFAKIGNFYFGARDDGIYRLEGETDAGAEIDASVVLGAQDFGTSALKRVANVYLGVESSGALDLRVTVNDGESYTYAARRADAFKRTQRVDLGRGLQSSLYEFELRSDGAFELDSMEFNVGANARRI